MKVLEKQEFTKDLQLLLNCQAEKETKLIKLQQKLQQLNQSGKDSDKTRTSKAKLKQQIALIEQYFVGVENYQKLNPGDWICNGIPRPGKITGKYISPAFNPEFWVLWEADRVEKSINAGVVTPIDPKALDYCWIDNQLWRAHDGKICDELEILLRELISAKNCLGIEKQCDGKQHRNEELKHQINWIKRRWAIVVKDKFPRSARVIHESQEVSVNGYEMDRQTGLLFVWLKSDRQKYRQPVDKVVNPTELKSITGLEDLAVKSENQIDTIVSYGSQPEIKIVLISQIRRDGNTQQRVDLNRDTLIDYSQAMERGDRFPPVKLKYDGENYWLYDGFHTTEAALLISRSEIEAEITEGTQRDAILESVAVNANHGLRRTNADKRRAVTTLLKDEEWGKWSDRSIARRCKVDHKTVGKIRADLTGEIPSHNPKVYKDKYGNTSTMNTANIGNGETITTVNSQSEINPPYNDGVISDRWSNNEIVNNKESQAVLLTEKAENENSGATSQQNNSFEVGNIVFIRSNRSDKRLVGYNSAKALITEVFEHSVNLKVWSHEIENVAKQDIKKATGKVSICALVEPVYLKLLMGKYDSLEDFIVGSLGMKAEYDF